MHDVSWGTKGDNTVAKDLGTVTTTSKTGKVEAEVPTDEKDINALYEDAIHVLNTKPPKVESKPDQGTQQEDYYRSFRTKWVFFWFLVGGGFGVGFGAVLMVLSFAFSVLLAWVLTNGLLAAGITSTNTKASDGGANRAVNGYMGFLLASVAILACEFLLFFFFFLFLWWLSERLISASAPAHLPAVVRFVGSTTYMIVRLFAGE